MVYVSKLIPTTDSKFQEEFPKYVDEYRKDQQNIAYAVWFRHELLESGLQENKPKARAAK